MWWPRSFYLIKRPVLCILVAVFDLLVIIMYFAVGSIRGLPSPAGPGTTM